MVARTAVCTIGGPFLAFFSGFLAFFFGLFFWPLSFAFSLARNHVPAYVLT
jgi:hypothetical protein